MKYPKISEVLQKILESPNISQKFPETPKMQSVSAITFTQTISPIPFVLYILHAFICVFSDL